MDFDTVKKWFSHENIRLALEILGVAFLIPTLIFTVKSAVSSADSAKAAAGSLDAAVEQIDQGKYQSVYEQQLDLWKLAAEHGDLGMNIIGGANSETSAKLAAKALTLDFYAYVYSQLAPAGSTEQPMRLALDESKAPPGVSPDEWVAWQSWSHTIAEGFLAAPDLCQQLRGNEAYWLNFREAVDEAWLPPRLDDNGQPLPLEKVCK